MNIHVVALFHSQDLKTYRFDDILKPLVDDLKILETQGIEVPFSDSPLLGSVIQVTGDNLGLHGLFGFVESFSATYFCRFCLTSKVESQFVFTEDDPGMIFRTKEIHAEHCAAQQENPMSGSTFGVKKTYLIHCIFSTPLTTMQLTLCTIYLKVLYSTNSNLPFNTLSTISICLWNHYHRGFKVSTMVILREKIGQVG